MAPDSTARRATAANRAPCPFPCRRTASSPPTTTTLRDMTITIANDAPCPSPRRTSLSSLPDRSDDEDPAASASSASASFSALQPLSNSPVYLPGCCLSLSRTLFNRVGALLPTSASVLSVGSGTGLFEQYLQRAWPDLHVEGVEVARTVNLYLPAHALHVVGGTWALCERAKEVDVWLFVYPRQPSLCALYMAQLPRSKVQTLLWLGARSDWGDFEPCLTDIPGFKSPEVDEDSGLVEYEMMVVIRKNS